MSKLLISFTQALRPLAWVLLGLALASSLSAKATSEYRWLENPGEWPPITTDRQTEWFKDQKTKFEAYHSRLKQDSIKSEIEKYHLDRKSLKKLTLEDGRVLELFIEKEATGFVLTLNNEVVLDSAKLSEITNKAGLWGTFTFYEFFVSPDQKHLALPIYDGGSSSKSHVVIFNLNEKLEFHSLIKNVWGSDYLYWIDSNRIQYLAFIEGSRGDVSFEFDLISKRSFLPEDSNNFVSGLNNGEFLYYQTTTYKTSEKGENLQERKLFVKHFSHENFSEFKLEEEYYLRLLAKTDSYLVLAESRDNIKKLYFFAL